MKICWLGKRPKSSSCSSPSWEDKFLSCIQLLFPQTTWYGLSRNHTTLNLMMFRTNFLYLYWDLLCIAHESATVTSACVYLFDLLNSREHLCWMWCILEHWEEEFNLCWCQVWLIYGIQRWACCQRALLSALKKKQVCQREERVFVISRREHTKSVCSSIDEASYSIEISSICGCIEASPLLWRVKE